MNKDDMISRASFRSNIQTVLNDTTCPLHIAAEIEEYLDLEPAVNAAPMVHGRWIRSENGDGIVCENPEPVYPTWFEYIYDISNLDYFDLTEFYTWMRHTSIPADIAQKLGITPKENN